MKLLTKLTRTLFILLMIGGSTVLYTNNAQAQHKKGHAKAHPKKAPHKKGPVKHKAHVRYAHLPRRGAVISTVPKGNIVVTHKGVKFKFHNGVFYKPKGATFVVVRPPCGLKIAALPAGHLCVVVKKKRYFYYYGTFYVKTAGVEEYEVVEAPVGAEVDALPEGYEISTVDGVEYYTLEDAKYQAVEKEDGTVMYQVVSTE